MKSSQELINVDLYPTFAKLAGAKLTNQKKLDGIDMIESLTNNDISRDELLIQSYSSAGALIKGNYKLVKNGMIPKAVPYYGTVELFDIKNDPLETHNLVFAEPAKVKELELALAKYEKEAIPSILTSTAKIPENFVIPKVWSPQGLQAAQELKQRNKKINTRKNTLIQHFQRIPKVVLITVSFGMGVLLSIIGLIIYRNKKIKLDLKE